MPGPVIIVLVLVVVLVLEKCFIQRVWSTIDASSGLFRHCIPNQRSMSRTRTIARRGGARFLAQSDERAQAPLRGSRLISGGRCQGALRLTIFLDGPVAIEQQQQHG